MFSLAYPEVMTSLAGLGPGLWPFRTAEDGLVLAAKASSELAFAAKHKREFTFHFYRLEVGGQAAIGLMTAVYDRSDAPIVIQTVCIDKVMRDCAAEIARKSSIRVYFFDSHSSELFGGTWKLNQQDKIVDLIESCRIEIPAEKSLEYYVELDKRFANPSADDLTIDVTLVSETKPENVTFLHVTEDSVSSQREEGLGIYKSNLDYDPSPGARHEAEIARLLARAYTSDQIYVNPDVVAGREFCDVLAIGVHEAIVIQAKTTPLDESRFSESDDRRDRRLNKHFLKALAQVKGAERVFYKLSQQITYQKVALELNARTKLLIHVIVIYDKPPHLLPHWSSQVAAFATDLIPVVVLSMDEYVNILNLNREREPFVSALLAIAEDTVRRKAIGLYRFGRGRIAISDWTTS